MKNLTFETILFDLSIVESKPYGIDFLKLA